MINVFFKSTSNELTLHREHDYKIKIKKINFRKLDFVKKYFENNLKKEFIIVNYAFCLSSILLIKKSNDKLKFCVNYRKLNQMIKKNRYFISFITKIFAQLLKVKIFFKINIRQIFHKFRMKEVFENLIIFITKFGVYK